LAVADEEAGGVGECNECGAKFRIPKTKVTTAAPRRHQDDDDEDEDDRPVRRRRDDDDDEDNEPAPRPLRRSEGMSQAGLNHLKMAAIMLGLLIVLGLAAIFIGRLGPMFFLCGVAGGLACAMMVVRTATKEGGFWGGICVLLAILIVLSTGGASYYVFNTKELPWPMSLLYFISPFFWSSFLVVFVVGHWQETQRFAFFWVWCVLLCAAMFVAVVISTGRTEARRLLIRERITKDLLKSSLAPPVQVDYRA
jgi:hypothetical protein